MLSRSSLETQKLELLALVSELKRQQAAMERENIDLRDQLAEERRRNKPPIMPRNSPYPTASTPNQIVKQEMKKETSEHWDEYKIEYTIKEEERDAEDPLAPDPLSEVEEPETNNNDTILVSSPSKEGRKKNACPFCDPQELISCSNYCRHLIRNHENELKVQQLMVLPKNSSKRRQVLADLRNMGNYLYNSSKSTFFIPSRRPLKEKSPKKSCFVTCVDCLIMVKRKNFFLHRKTCKKNQSNIAQCKGCNQIMSEGLLAKHKKECRAEPNHDKEDNSTPNRQRRVLQGYSMFVDKHLVGASQDLIQNVLPLQRVDEISEVVKSDPLILSVGSKLRSSHKEARAGLAISSKMRDLAKLLLKMKKDDASIKSFKDALRSRNVQLLFKGVKELSGLNEATGEVKVPSMPRRLKGQLNIALQTVKNDIKTDPNLSYDTKKELLLDFQNTDDIIKSDWKSLLMRPSL